ncbi:MAG: hypothetical protein KF716_26575 [Anaerolineae bacterium]|nr:hypothetical protein [Anaerolineae bacterium]
MSDHTAFAAQIQAQFKEGLTGIFPIGGTRTTFILEKNRHQADPGEIPDFLEYATYLIKRYFSFIRMYFDLGGQNMILPLFSYQGFYERGEKYARQMYQTCRWLIQAEFQEFYRELDADPYFPGIDTLLHLPKDDPAHELGRDLADFQQHWQYKSGRRTIIWEVAPIPFYTFWMAQHQLSAEAEITLGAEIDAIVDLKVMYERLYQFYARAAYGIDLPVPHFYVGSNRNGDIKLRSPLSLSLLCGGPFRLYFTPYPTLFMKPATLQAIIEDVAFGKPRRALTYDYSGQFTPESAEAEYQRALKLSEDPNSTIGLTRLSETEDD